MSWLTNQLFSQVESQSFVMKRAINTQRIILTVFGEIMGYCATSSEESWCYMSQGIKLKKIPYIIGGNLEEGVLLLPWRLPMQRIEHFFSFMQMLETASKDDTRVCQSNFQNRDIRKQFQITIYYIPLVLLVLYYYQRYQRQPIICYSFSFVQHIFDTLCGFFCNSGCFDSCSRTRLRVTWSLGCLWLTILPHEAVTSQYFSKIGVRNFQ